MANNLKWELADKIRGYGLNLQKMKLRVLEYYILRSSYPSIFDNWNRPYTSREHVQLVMDKKIPLTILPNEEGYFDYTSNVEDSTFDNDALFNTLVMYDLSDIREFLIDDSFGDNYYDCTPQSIIDLSISLFGSTVKKKPLLDLCSGTGSFLYQAKRNNVASKYYGVEINIDSYISSLIKMQLDDPKDTYMYRGDVFAPFDILTNKSKVKFGGVFSNFPFGLRIQDQEKPNFDEKFKTENDLPITRRNTTDYSFISLMLRNLDKTGKAIAVTAGGPLFNSIDQDIRKYMIDNGLIESIIELPERLFYYTSIKTYLIVMSFGNKSIRFVDLSKCILEKQRNTNILDVSKSIELINSNEENDFMKVVNMNDVDNQRYNLVPTSYLHQSRIDILNGQDLDEVCEVFTGWQVSSAQLDARFISNPEENDCVTQIIQMGDVNDGIITRNTNLYKVDDKQFEKFSLKNGDVVISTKSAKVKSAVVEISDNERLIASGSIMVLRVIKDKIDPYYLRAFLDSPIGQHLLSLKQTGNVIPNLTVNNVKKLQIPLLPVSKQKQLAMQYKDKLDKINFEKKRLAKLEKEVDSLFDFVTNGDSNE